MELVWTQLHISIKLTKLGSKTRDEKSQTWLKTDFEKFLAVFDLVLRINRL